MGHVIGIDKGTSFVKAVVFDAAGRALGLASARVAVLSPEPGWHEEDPEASWALTERVIREAMAQSGVDPASVMGIGIAGHMGGLWLIDGAGKPVRNAICWPDARAQALQIGLEQTGALERAFAISGNGMMPGISVMLMAWLSRHEPESLARSRYALCAKDYLRFRLTGEIATDPSDVSFVPGDIDARDFSPELMRLCGADAWADRLPPVIASEAIAGRLTPAAAVGTGLPAGIPVVTGLGDACANALGTGCVAPGQSVTVLGTSCLNSRVLDRASRQPEGMGFLFAMPFGRYLRILPNTSGTITMDWFLESFGGPRRADGAWDFAAAEALAGAIPRGAGGVILLPYINGSGVLAPFHDARARGAFFGASSQTSRDHLLRAVYEALCYSTRDCLAAMPGQPGQSGPSERLTLTGGGSRSAFWAQMFADICRVGIDVTDTAESGALGVAMLAGAATGLWSDLEEALGATQRRAASYEPDPVAAADYDDWFGLYREVSAMSRRHFAARAALSLADATGGQAA
ncbi:MAG: FGGY-family carbohydrate kinase [Amaricoccus sp.]|uniref:FGGY-family carbohydrate kinase n=1 Tax=Amaricoccus sp. TaxID=1872485 RepID=UPI0039E54258